MALTTKNFFGDSSALDETFVQEFREEMERQKSLDPKTRRRNLREIKRELNKIKKKNRTR